ncbi:MAG: EAL domain-containing protein [Geothermobacteraceae bacterium]
MNSLFLTRQPIHNDRFEVIGYQVLHAPAGARADIANVPENRMPDPGLLERLVGTRPAFINVDSGLLFNPKLADLPLDRTVLQLPPGLEPDAGVEQRLAQIEALGARFALDGYKPSDRRSRLVPRASYVKVDIAERPAVSLPDLVGSKTGPERLVACRVDSHEQFEECRQQGIRHFQGRFFRRPRWTGSRRLPASSLSVMQLLARLQDPQLELADIEAIVERDVSLSYRLLRYINSVHFALRSPIESIGHALSYLGLEHLRVWLSVLLLARLDHKPVELMKTALVRARMCQGLLENGGTPPAGSFLLGLFSTLDALLDQPLEEAVWPLPVSERLKEALIDRSGEEGGILKLVLAWEDGNWPQVGSTNLEPERLLSTYLDAVGWTEDVAGAVLAD